MRVDGRQGRRTNKLDCVHRQGEPYDQDETRQPDRRGYQLADLLHRTPSLLDVADLAHNHATLESQLEEMIGTEANGHQRDKLREAGERSQ